MPASKGSNQAVKRADPTAAAPVARGPAMILDEPPTPIGKTRALTIPLGFGMKLMLEGWFFRLLFVGFFLYLYAGWTANEWMYLLAGGIFVSLILGTILPFLQVVEVSAVCSIPEQIVVSEWADVKIKLDRRFLFGPLSQLMPVSSLRVRTNLLRRAAAGRAAELILDPEPLLIKNLDEQSWLELPTPELRRGIYFVDKVELLSCFPFGLAWWSRAIEVKTKDSLQQPKITVHPLALDVSGNFLLQLLGLRSTMGLSNSSSIIVPQSSSVRSVREFKPGDSIRHVHWPSTAKQGKILVREFDSEQLPVFDLLLDLRANWKNQEQFEVAVCLAHSIIHHGFKLGIKPELTLNPPLDSKVVQKNLMFDLPQVPFGLDLLAEILARVEPVSSTVLYDETKVEPESNGQPDAEKDENDNVYDAKHGRPLVTIIPLQELVMKHNLVRGDHMVAPMELAIIPRNWEDEEEQSEVAAVAKPQVQFKAARGPKGSSRGPGYRSVGHPANTTIIATIDGESDFLAL
jgi:uncharacterized protein (DUF58 family)